jgi:serine-type D-Ala-D-Ala carboxypeptidase (penicillin-binding protein 5/6)
MSHRPFLVRPLIATAASAAIFAGPVAAGTVLAGTAAAPASAAPVSGRPAAEQARASGPQGVRASGADLVDASAGRLLWSRKLDVRRPMGSITKVMTALLVIRAGHLNREITVTRAAVQYVLRNGASSAGLKAGDVLTARELLDAMLIPSGCDAAYLLATAYGTGRQPFVRRRSFVRKMNAAAAALGLTSTHFSGFDGLPIPTEWSTYSTPANLVRLGEVAMRYKLFRQIVAERRDVLAKTALHHRYAWTSTNWLLRTYSGTIGIKTGTTLAAGDCLLFEARRGGDTLIGVVLHADPTDSAWSRFAAARRMLSWGFSQELAVQGVTGGSGSRARRG